MGAESLELLEEHFLQPTRLSAAEQYRVRALFDRVRRTLVHPTEASFRLRRSEVLGANAFALPSGIVVMTDELIEIADNDEQIAAVLAHELGHVHHRHIMRSLLQNSIAALVIASLLGDVTSITGLAASIPTFLVEQRYSRAFEYEADAFAVEWMRAQGIDEMHLADILRGLHEAHGGGDDDGVSKYLSTHPAMSERIEALRH